MGLVVVHHLLWRAIPDIFLRLRGNQVHTFGDACGPPRKRCHSARCERARPVCKRRETNDTGFEKRRRGTWLRPGHRSGAQRDTHRSQHTQENVLAKAHSDHNISRQLVALLASLVAAFRDNRLHPGSLVLRSDLRYPSCILHSHDHGLQRVHASSTLQL